MKLHSKTAVVTGASRGTGRAITTGLLEKGAVVYGIARDASAMQDLKKQWTTSFIDVELDITNEQAVREWAARTFSEENLPDILINNAGAGFFDKIDVLSSEKWHQMVNTNLNAIMYLTSSLVPRMKTKENHSHIINIGSILGKVTGAEKSAYSATKYALQGFTESLFKELRGDRIKVSCVNPGSIETDFFKESGIEATDNMLKPSDVAETVIFLLETPDNVLIDELTLRPLVV